MDPTLVTFIERSGDDAESALRRLRRRLEHAGLACRLLRGRGQRELYLLLVEGDPDLARDEAHGANVWRFEDRPRTDVGAAGVEADAARGGA